MIPKTLIILPGWGGSHKTWAEFIALAKNEFSQVRVIDLPCFGNEPCPKEVWGIEEYSNYVKQKFESLKIENVILMGHSFGGQVATYLVAQNPQICEKLILTGAAVIRPKRTLKRLLFGSLAKCGKLVFTLPGIQKIQPLAKKALYRSADSPDYTKTSGIQQDIFKKVIRQDLVHLLPQITVPTAVIWGEKDSYTPLRHGNIIASKIPQAQMHVIIKGTHGLHLTKKSELLERITQFLKS